MVVFSKQPLVSAEQAATLTRAMASQRRRIGQLAGRGAQRDAEVAVRDKGSLVPRQSRAGCEPSAGTCSCLHAGCLLKAGPGAQFTNAVNYFGSLDLYESFLLYSTCIDLGTRRWIATFIKLQRAGPAAFKTAKFSSTQSAMAWLSNLVSHSEKSADLRMTKAVQEITSSLRKPWFLRYADCCLAHTLGHSVSRYLCTAFCNSSQLSLPAL